MKQLTLTDGFLAYRRRVDEQERQFDVIAPKLTWNMLFALEPRLDGLHRDSLRADSRHETESFCGLSFWHRQLKPRLVSVVGHCRPDSHIILGTSAAYDIAYDTLFAAVPGCRNCINCGSED